MRASSRLLLLLVVLGLVLAAVPPTASAQGETPVWAAGDSWNWQSTTGNFGLTFLHALVVVDVESVSVGGTAYAAYHAKAWTNVSGSTQNYTAGDEWFRTSDLALLKTVLAYNVTSGAGPRYTTTTTYAPPVPLHFPLVANDSWAATTVITTETVTTGGSTTWSNDTRQEALSVGTSTQDGTLGGTFTVLPVTEDVQTGFATGYRFLSYWSTDVGNYVEWREYDGSSLVYAITLTGYRYAQPASGGLPTFLGLPALAWALLAIAAVVVAVFVLVPRLRGRREAGPPPPT